jgi:hypothetical protein
MDSNEAVHRPGAQRGRAARQRIPIDWMAVERDYRTGALSLREMAQKHRCSHSSIANFADRHGWTRERDGSRLDLARALVGGVSLEA